MKKKKKNYKTELLLVFKEINKKLEKDRRQRTFKKKKNVENYNQVKPNQNKTENNNYNQ